MKRAALAALLALASPALADGEPYAVQAVWNYGSYCKRTACHMFGLRGAYEETTAGGRAEILAITAVAALPWFKVSIGSENVRRYGGWFDLGYFTTLEGLGATTGGGSAVFFSGVQLGAHYQMVTGFLQLGPTMEVTVRPVLGQFKLSLAIDAGIGARF